MALANSYSSGQKSIDNTLQNIANSLFANYNGLVLQKQSGENSMAASGSGTITSNTLLSICGALLLLLCGIVGYEFNSLRTEVADIRKDVGSDISGIRKDLVANNAALLEKLGSIDEKFSVAVQHLNDIKVNIRGR